MDTDITDPDVQATSTAIHIPEMSPFRSIEEINLFDEESEPTETLEVTEQLEITDKNIPDFIAEHTVAQAIQTHVAEIEIETSDVIIVSETTPANNQRFQEHQHELRQMAVFCLSIFTMSLLPYTSPALADYRPWTAEEAPPLIGLWTSQQKMTEDASGALITVTDPLMDSIDDNLEIEPLIEHSEEEMALSAINEIAIVVPTEDHLNH